MAKVVTKRVVRKKSKQETESLDLCTSLVSSIQKTCGKEAATSLDKYTDTITSKPVSWVSTGIRSFDMAVSNGRGLPCGKVIEIFGAEATGKTAYCQYMIKQYQLRGGLAVYIDFETAIDTDHLKAYGIDLGNLIYVSVETVEEGFDVVMSVIKHLESEKAKTGKTPPVLIAWDSIAMSTPRAETTEAEHGSNHVGLLARSMSKGMRKIRRRIAKVNCTLCFTNQVRDNIGVMFGDKLTVPGGRAVRFTASIRVKTSRIKTLFATKNKKKVPVGYIIECDVKKTRFTAPHQKCRFVISFSCGIDVQQSALLYLTELGLLRKAGKQYLFVPTKQEFKRRDWKTFYKENRSDINKAMHATEESFVISENDDSDDSSDE